MSASSSRRPNSGYDFSDSAPLTLARSQTLSRSHSQVSSSTHLTTADDSTADLSECGPYSPRHLNRNKSERARLQGLQRAPTMGSQIRLPPKKQGLGHRFNVWMINEGHEKLSFGIYVLLHVLVALLGFLHYLLKDNATKARATYGITFPIARTSALVLHVDVIFILLPVCRNFISFLRRTPLNDIIPFDKNISFHKATGWSILIFSIIHTLAHVVNVTRSVVNDVTLPTTGRKVVGFLSIAFISGPGATGWVMLIVLGVMVWFAMEKRRRASFERFWYTHHLFIIFFVCWQLHGMFCMIKPDRPPYCSYNTIGVFWRYWLMGGLLWIWERILREIRARHQTYVSKVVQHPSNVMELQIKKEKITTRAGQYIFICCPEISHFQWHPFTLTSAPEEDYISVHIRIVGDFTKALAVAMGCNFDAESRASKALSVVIGTNTYPPVDRVLPRVMVDGPFGTASEDFLKYETVLLIGAGIGVTPFASILKSIWYRMSEVNDSKPTRLSKVYFTWVVRDFGSCEWFHSLLHAIEEQDLQNRIEINLYLTAKINADDAANIFLSDVGAEKDAITSLRSPTHFGRPNWDRVFSAITENHPDTDVGVFFCGPNPLSKQLHLMSNKYSDPAGTRFFYSKENF